MAVHLSCLPKKDAKKGTLAIFFSPSLTVIKRARDTALFLFITDVSAQFGQRKVAVY